MNVEKKENRESIPLTVEDLTYAKNCKQHARSNKLKVARDLKTILTDRFASFEDPIYQSMKFYNPKIWDDENPAYGEDQIKCIYNHFEEPLLHHNFSLPTALNEWKSFKILVRESYADFTAKCLWKMILKSRYDEYPQLALLAKLLFAISGSNSTVERAFSTLTLILTDRRISLNHNSIEDIMIINGNDVNWTIKEKEEIIARAREIYKEKRRRTRMEGEPPIKKREKVIKKEEIPEVDDLDIVSADEEQEEDDYLSTFSSSESDDDSDNETSSSDDDD